MANQRSGEQIRVLRGVSPAFGVGGKDIPCVRDVGARDEGEEEESQSPQGDEDDADQAGAVGPGRSVEEAEELAEEGEFDEGC
jgi:hypothetical protein